MVVDLQISVKIRFTSTVTLSDAGHVSSTRERMVELVRGALADTDYKVRKGGGRGMLMWLCVEQSQSY